MLELGFRLTGGGPLGERDLPLPAQVNLAVTGWYGSVDEETGLCFMSPLLASEGEIDHWIQRYKDELDRVGADAKKALAKANKQTLESIRERRSEP